MWKWHDYNDSLDPLATGWWEYSFYPIDLIIEQKKNFWVVLISCHCETLFSSDKKFKKLRDAKKCAIKEAKALLALWNKELKKLET